MKMLLHKKSILIGVVVLLSAMVWAVSANSLVDQRSVLDGRVVAQDLAQPGASVKEGRVLDMFECTDMQHQQAVPGKQYRIRIDPILFSQDESEDV